MDRPLRIASFTYSTKSRGGVVHTLALAEQLQALGHGVHIFALGKDGKGFFRPISVPHTLIPIKFIPVDQETLDVRIERYIDTYMRYLQTLDLTQFDVFHVQDCVSANALFRLKLAGKIDGFIRTVHHVDDFTSPKLIQCQDDSIYRAQQRIVVSRYWQERLSAEYKVDSDIIYNGVDVQRFQPPTADQRRAARAAFGLSDDTFVYLNIGGVEPRKNSIRLMQAFEQVRDALAKQGRKTVQLFVGGETILDHSPYRNKFETLYGDSTLVDGVDLRHLGVVGDAEIPKLYHAADALTFPSIKEGWGLVVLEAMASGLPVVTSDLPVFREYIDHERNALLIDPTSVEAIADGMLRLEKASPMRARLIAEGFETAQQFGWDRTARAHVAAYEKLLAPVASATG